jgi:probable HAF family extracellular repeat protein
MVDLATLSQGTASVVRGPNNQGIAGGSGRLVGARGRAGRHGLLFQDGAGPQEAAAPSAEDSAVFSINDNGAFVGTSNTTTSVRAFAGSRAGGVRELAPLSGDNASVAFGINNLGQAVGFSSGAGGQRAVVWQAGGAATSLPTLGGAVSSRANDISSKGDVAGVVTTGAGPMPVLWPSGQSARALQLIPGDSSGEASAVNSRGEAVGYTANASGTVRHAALWAPTGAVTGLGALPGGEFSQAFGSNDSGAVVGSATSSAGERAFLWTRAGGMQDLNNLVAPSQVVLTKATGINNAGLIVAVGHEPLAGEPAGGHAHDEEAHELPVRVFLLRPIGGAP